MKILFYSTKDFEKKQLDAANKLAHEIHYINEPLSQTTVDNAIGFDAISIFTSDDASAEVLLALNKIGVKYISTRATGYDNIDIDKANELEIIVAHVPSYSPYSIAEHAVALVLAVIRKIATANNQVHKQNFLINNLVGFDLYGKTVGIIGVGKIGAVFAKIMHGFGCEILGYDLVENKQLTELYGVKYVDLKYLCAQSNIISIHTGLSPSTKYLINKNCIDQMQHGTILINTGRGGCVNTKDVISGLENRRIGYYAADVYENEKGIFFHDLSTTGLQDELLKKLLSMPNVLITPHQAFATQEALTDIANSTFYNIDCWSNNQHSKDELTVQWIDEEIVSNENS
jgi:D-lactate dehydrogenase